MKKAMNNLYKREILAIRLKELRTEKKYTLKELAKKIKECTRVSISSMQLSKYENIDLTENMNINNFVAIANFYNVSTDYLLGMTSSKSYKYTDKMTSQKYGISDKSMKTLEKFNNKDELKIKMLNCLLENEIFLNVLLDNIIEFYKSKDSTDFVIDEIESKYGISLKEIANFASIKKFEEFMNSSYEKIWKKKEDTLFDM